MPNGGGRALFWVAAERGTILLPGPTSPWSVYFAHNREPIRAGLTERQARAFEDGAADGFEGTRAGWLYTDMAEYAEGRAVGERLRAEHERRH